MIGGLWHTSFTVSDLERSVRFYRDLLGLEVVHRQVQDNEYTRLLVGVPGAVLNVAQLCVPGLGSGPSGHHLELIEYVGEPPVEPRIGTRYVGAPHLAFATDDLNADHERLRAAGVTFVSDPVAITAGKNEGGMAVYLRDPDGITLELVQAPKRQEPGQTGGRK